MKWATETIGAWRRTPISLIIFLLTILGVILFIPDSMAHSLALDEFRARYRVILGPAFVLALGWVSARIVSWLFHLHRIRQALKRRTEMLSNLTPEERGYLAEYILGGTNSVHVGLDDGVMAGLVRKRITYLASGSFNILQGPPFNLQPWARAELEEHPELLEGAVGHPMTPRERLHQW